MVLSTSGLRKSFDGVVAVDDVDFELEEGQLCSVIGPNGAGKTTFFNLLTGTLAPTAGTIHYRPSGEPEPRDITDLSPHETAALGIHRSFQITNIFPTTSVLENVRIAVQAHSEGDSWRFWRNVNAFEDHEREARAILERIGLAESADRQAESLSHGEKRNLEVGIALAGDPDVLLLDEPTAGVSSEGVEDVTAIIEDVASDHTVLLIEHNMDVVMDISDRIVVLNRGELIADGPPAEIRESEAVKRAYLGGYESDAGDADQDAGNDESDSGVTAG
jgi:branched-chain amino acid transport system ATP-binding protein